MIIRRRKQGTEGFSLIEMIVAMAIFSILASIAIPAFREMIANQRIRSASFDLVASLSLARSEAVKQNGNVTVAPAGDAWNSGWTITGPGGLVKTQAAYPEMTITGPTNIVYSRNGRVTAGTGSLQISAATSGPYTVFRCITISPAGLPTVKPEECPS